MRFDRRQRQQRSAEEQEAAGHAGHRRRQQCCHQQAQLLQLDPLHGRKAPQHKRDASGNGHQRQLPAQRPQPQPNARCRQAHQQPVKKYLHAMKRKTDQRRQQEDHVHRIGKSLPVPGIVRPSRIQFAAVVSLLDFCRNVAAVGIAVMQQKFAPPQPARIKIGKIAPRTLVRRRVGFFIGNQHALHVEPHAACAQQRNPHFDLKVLTQGEWGNGDSGLVHRCPAPWPSMLQLML